MTFKYYGYKILKSSGRKEAFLLDGDDIIIAGEDEPVKRGRYKVVKIGVNSTNHRGHAIQGAPRLCRCRRMPLFMETKRRRRT